MNAPSACARFSSRASVPWPTRILAATLLAGLLAQAARAEGMHTGLMSPDPAGAFPSAGPGGGPGLVPTVSAAEAALLDRVRALAPTNLTAAIQVLAGLELAKASPAMGFTLANLRLQNHEYDPARVLYEDVLKRHPTFRDAWANLGRARLYLNQNQPAAEALQKALRLLPGDGQTLLLLGGAYVLLNQPASAESAFRQALVLSPGDASARRGIARALLDQQRVAEALGWVAELLREFPHDPGLWSLRGQALASLDRGEEACAALETADRLGVLAAGDRLLLADLHRRAERWADAARVYEVAARNPRSRPADLFRACESLLRAGRAEEARGLFSLIPTPDPEEESAPEQAQRLRLEADLELAANRPAEAQTLLRRLLAVAPDDGRALLSLGDLQQAGGEEEAALLSFERAARCPGHEAAGLLRQAALEARRQRFDRAATLAEAAIPHDPREDVRRYAEQLRRRTGSR